MEVEMTYFHCFFRTIDGVLLQENFIYIEFEVARKDQKHKIISYTPSVNIANMETKTLSPQFWWSNWFWCNSYNFSTLDFFIVSIPWMLCEEIANKWSKAQINIIFTILSAKYGANVNLNIPSWVFGRAAIFRQCSSIPQMLFEEIANKWWRAQNDIISTIW